MIRLQGTSLTMSVQEEQGHHQEPPHVCEREPTVDVISRRTEVFVQESDYWGDFVNLYTMWCPNSESRHEES
jgi:hypothetical protein